MSVPPTIRSKASSTQVFDPPFLWKLPLAEAMTTGRDVRDRTTAGAANTAPEPRGAAAATRPVDFMNARRDWRGFMMAS